MLVEHTLITTLEPVEVFHRLTALLAGWQRQEMSDREIVYSR